MIVQRPPNKGILKLIAIFAVMGSLLAFSMLSWIKYRSDILAQEFLKPGALDNPFQLATEVYDTKGIKIGEFAAEQRYFVSLDRLPKHVVNAFLAAEDARFYHHSGVSLIAIARAAFANVKAGKVVQGASTISQQLARIFFLSTEKTARRKFDEMSLALALESHLGKKRILELYLNKIFLGNHSYGIESAARNYFRKSADDLTIAEAALLAGVVAAPSKYAPHRYFKKAKARQQYVLRQMSKEGFIAEEEAQRCLEHQLIIAKTSLKNDEKAPYFVSEIKHTVSRHLAMHKLESAGLRVETSLDMEYQSILRKNLSDLVKRHVSDGLQLGRDDTVQASAAIIKIRTGEILALEGGLDYTASEYNRAFDARRPLGSLFMPIYYGIALDRGQTLLSSLYEQKKTVRPDLSNKERKDDLSLYEGLIFAKAAESARLFSWLGIGTVTSIAQRLGLTFEKNDLSLALGYGATEPIKILTAYGMIANGGVKIEEYLVRRVLDGKAKILFEQRREENAAVISPQAAFMVKQTLMDATRLGASQLPEMLAGRFAGMVGTDEGLHDGWYLGFNDDIGFVLWVGSEFGRTRLALSQANLRQKMSALWADLAKFLPKTTEESASPPEGVSFVRVSAAQNPRLSYFIPVKEGFEPL